MPCKHCLPSRKDAPPLPVRRDKAYWWKRLAARQKKEIEMAYQGMDVEMDSTRGLLLTALDSPDLGTAKTRIRAALKSIVLFSDRGRNPLPF